MENDGKEIPEGVVGFSWAAFLWGGIWAVGHRVWIGLFAFVPCFGLVMNVMLGLRGREWAFRAGSVGDVAAFNRAQRTWVIVWLALTVLLVPLVGVSSAMSIYGVTKYVRNAKRAEAQAAVARFSSGLVRCAQERGGLPESSRWVPEEVPHAQKYQSAASDWAETAFACSGFRLSDPQYFHYRWLQISPSSGEVQAEADLDGDGRSDNLFRQVLNCNGTSCVAEPMVVGPIE